MRCGSAETLTGWEPRLWGFMKRLLLTSLALIVLLAGGAAVDLAMNPPHRVAVMEGLCKAGLPNLSRPPELSSESLGCAILGPRQRVTGFVEGGFEIPNLVVGDRYRVDAQGYVQNETVWFESTPSDLWDPVRRAREEMDPDCLVTIVKVTVEGRMTVSKGGFGHLNMAPRAFYADRIIAVEPATPEAVAAPINPKAAICLWTGDGWAKPPPLAPALPGA